MTEEGIDDGAPVRVFCEGCDGLFDASGCMSDGRLVLLLFSEGFGFARLREREPIMAVRVEGARICRNMIVKTNLG